MFWLCGFSAFVTGSDRFFFPKKPLFFLWVPLKKGFIKREGVEGGGKGCSFYDTEGEKELALLYWSS
jgi:hypothetical protein